MSLPTIVSFWYGPMSDMAKACLASFVAQGHRVELYSYLTYPELPAGVELRRADAVLPFAVVERMIKGHHYAIASDIFRYEMLHQGLGVWVDCDCFCVRPIRDEDYIMAWEDEASIAIGVLKAPPDSELTRAMRGIREGFIPPWSSTKRKITWAVRRAVGLPKPLTRMVWGTTGPAALTYYARQYGVDRLAKPPATFYPIHYSEVDRLLDENETLENLVKPETVVLHLYNEALRGRAVPTTSPLGRILASVSTPQTVD